MGRWYRPDARFGEAFCRLAVALLGERCPLLVDAQLPELKAAQRPLLRPLVERRAEVGEALARAEDRDHRPRLPAAGAPQPGTAPLLRPRRRRAAARDLDGEDGWALARCARPAARARASRAPSPSCWR
jgi:hypothetical protein